MKYGKHKRFLFTRWQVMQLSLKMEQIQIFEIIRAKMFEVTFGYDVVLEVSSTECYTLKVVISMDGMNLYLNHTDDLKW